MEANSSINDAGVAASFDPVNAYRFILPTFEGPLDLLLHLI